MPFIKHFLIRFILFCIPLYLLIALYFLLDPFKVLYPWKYRYDGNELGVINRELISYEKWMRYSEKQQYDSFMFGSSRVTGFRVKDWKEKLPVSAMPFFFDASGENVEGICQKLTWLHQRNVNIHNAIILLDADCSFGKSNYNDFLYLHHYELSGMNPITYHLAFFASFFKKGFFLHYLDYRLFSTWHKWFEKFFDKKIIIHSQKFNELINLSHEIQLRTDEKAYYKQMRSVQFYPVQNKSVIYYIDFNQCEMLLRIKNVFDLHQTDYRIVVSPLFTRIPLGEVNYSILISIFGKDRVFDFSKCDTIIADYTNYYERSHFRPKIGKYILDNIY